MGARVKEELQVSAIEKARLAKKPFIKVSEIAELLEISYSAAQRIKNKVMAQFNLKPLFVSRMIKTKYLLEYCELTTQSFDNAANLELKIAKAEASYTQNQQ